MPFIPSVLLETISIIRYTGRSASTTVASGISISIQPVSRGEMQGDMVLNTENAYHGMPVNAIAGIREGDAVQRSGSQPRLYIKRIDSVAGIQRLRLEEQEERVL